MEFAHTLWQYFTSFGDCPIDTKAVVEKSNNQKNPPKTDKNITELKEIDFCIVPAALACVIRKLFKWTATEEVE